MGFPYSLIGAGGAVSIASFAMAIRRVAAEQAAATASARRRGGVERTEGCLAGLYALQDPKRIAADRAGLFLQIRPGRSKKGRKTYGR